MKQILRLCTLLRVMLFALLGVFSLSCQQEQHDPGQLPLHPNLGEALPESVRLPLELDFSVDNEVQEDFRSVSLTGTPIDNEYYPPEFDWSESAWGTADGKPIVLVAISNARTPNPRGGVHEQFLIIDDSKCHVELQGKRPPKLRIYGDVTLAAGTVPEEYHLTAMVLDRRYRSSAARFVETGELNLHLEDEYHSITSQTAETDRTQVHHNFIYGLRPVSLAKYLDGNTPHANKMDLRFKPLSAVFVLEFAAPHSNHEHARLESNLFTTQARLTMSGVGLSSEHRDKVYRMSQSEPVRHVFRDVFSGGRLPSERYRRVIVVALLNELYDGHTAAISAQYISDGQAEKGSDTGGVGAIPPRDYVAAFSGKVLFVNLGLGAGLVDVHRDEAKYFKTRWTSGPDGRIAFLAAPIYDPKDIKLAETFRGKIHYRKVGTDEWATLVLKDVDKNKVELKYSGRTNDIIQPNTEYDIWMENLSGFGTFLQDYSTPQNLLDVSQWGNSNEWSFNVFVEPPLCFLGAINLRNITTKDLPNLSRCPTLHYMFANCSNLVSVFRIEDWDVGHVENMVGMFRYAANFNGNLSKWNVGKVTNMSIMFEGAHAFNGDISRWNVSNVNDMSDMFFGARTFNQDLSRWDVSSVTNMKNMFAEASLFNSDISGWNVRNVIDLGGMFNSAGNFNQNLGAWKLSNVKRMGTPSYDPYSGRDAVLLFHRSGMSVENIEATFSGWKAFAEANPTVLRNIAWPINQTSIARFDNPAMVSLRWFRDNRGWTEVQK